MSARSARAYIGSHSWRERRLGPSGVVARPPPRAVPPDPARAPSPTSRSRRRMTGVTRGSPGVGESADGLRGHDQRVVVARHRPMAPGAMDADPVDLVALLRDLDRVEPPPADLRAHATRLVDARPRPAAGRAGCRRPSRLPRGRRPPRRRCTRTARRGEDRGSGPSQGRGRRRARGRRAAEARRSPARPCPSCPRRRGPRRSRRRCRRRTGRASSRPLRSPGRRRGATSRRNGSPPVPSPRRRAKTEPRPENGSRISGSMPKDRSSSAIRFAASSSGPGGSGGLTDGIRTMSCRNATRCSCAAAHVSSGSDADGRVPSVRAGAMVSAPRS